MIAFLAQRLGPALPQLLLLLLPPLPPATAATAARRRAVGRAMAAAGPPLAARAPPWRRPARPGHRAPAARAALPQRTLEFANDRGERLVGTLTEPEPGGAGGDPELAPVVILAHGWMGSRHSELLVRLATALGRSAGLAALRFDFSGCGDSGGDLRYGQYRSEARELHAARAFVEGSLGRRVGGLVGHSRGATDALLAAADGDDWPCVVALAARCDLQGGVLQRLGADVLAALDAHGQVEMRGRSAARGAFSWTLRREDLDDRLATDVAAACGRIARTPVLVVHGSADADVPLADARAIDAALAGPHELVVLQGADHLFTGAAMYEVAGAAATARRTTLATTAAATAPVKYATFYDAIVADKANHALLLSAVNANPDIVALLKLRQNVTAFIPTDKARRAARASAPARRAAAARARGGALAPRSRSLPAGAPLHGPPHARAAPPRPASSPQAFVAMALQLKLGLSPAKFSSNACLISAILRYHIVAPGMKAPRLAARAAPAPTKLVLRAGTTPAGAPQYAAKTLRFQAEGGTVRVVAPASSGLLVEPKNVTIVGGGVKHNINAVLLPAADLPALLAMTGCPASARAGAAADRAAPSQTRPGVISAPQAVALLLSTASAELTKPNKPSDVKVGDSGSLSFKRMEAFAFVRKKAADAAADSKSADAPKAADAAAAKPADAPKPADAAAAKPADAAAAPKSAAAAAAPKSAAAATPKPAAAAATPAPAAPKH
ncbi:hypothetical protein HT031_005824 [Scenedesmus sp. PABB004]|nr:hypothetical protein HT031_005824 [Scenedesmus sp. PABB004]